jgi:hypothetical protein
MAIESASGAAMAADAGFYAGASGGRSPIHSDNSQITLRLDLPQTGNPGDPGFKAFAGVGCRSIRASRRAPGTLAPGFNLSLFGSYDFGNF